MLIRVSIGEVITTIRTITLPIVTTTMRLIATRTSRLGPHSNIISDDILYGVYSA